MVLRKRQIQTLTIRALRQAPVIRPWWDEFDRMAIQRDALIAERNAAIAQRDALAAERNAEVAQRDALAAERDRAVLERNAAVAEREAILSQQSGRASENIDIGAQDYPGFRIYGYRDDQVVSAHILHGIFEPDVTAVFRRHVGPGMCAVDIGANVGYYSMLAASLVGPAGRVLAIEANPRNARLLEASRRLNGFENIDIANVAVGPGPALLALKTDHSNGMTPRLDNDPLASLKAETVPCLSLSQVLSLYEKIDVIKIDIEGSEYLALSGAQEIIKRDRPVVISEFSPWALTLISGIDPKAYLSFLVDCGMDISVILPTGETAQHGTDISSIYAAWEATGSDHIDILAVPTR